ncbi:MAG: metal-sulfur cluster assembly factor [Elusimicrobia bacterium]|nr:metal-sulfur cluster assembly factor [Elusimicrobiota bacterium]
MSLPPAPAVTFKMIGEAVRPVQDPEMHVSLADLGLVYGAELQPDPQGGSRVVLKLSLTSPACPYGPMMLASVRAALAAVPGVRDARVELAFDPPWDPRTMASDEAKDMLGIF